MPYLVTTHKSGCGTGLGGDGNEMPSQTRRAVATLEEARAAAYHEIGRLEIDAYAATARKGDAMTLPESGGTIGPLPDSTVIEVRRATNGEWRTVADELGLRVDAMTDREFVSAYNAKQSN